MKKKFQLLIAGLALFTFFVMFNSFQALEKFNDCTTTGYYDNYGHAIGDCGADDPVVKCDDGTYACTPEECECKKD